MENTPSTIHTLPLLPLKNIVLLPKSIVPVIIGREKSILAVKDALEQSREIFVSAQHDPTIDDPRFADLFSIGVRATILQTMPMPKDTFKVLLEGIERAELIDAEEHNGVWRATARSIPNDYDPKDIEIQAFWRQIKARYKQYVQMSNTIPSTVIAHLQNISNISDAADTVIVHSSLNFNDRQHLLEISSLKERLLTLYAYIEREIDILKTEARIRDQVQVQVEKNQREYYLNEQIKAINKELGRDDQLSEIEALRTKITAAKLPEEVLRKMERELRRLEQMPQLSAESAVTRNYIDWILSLPWHEQSKDRISLAQAEKILGQDHFGLEKAKERIIEFIAAKKFNPALNRTPILCLVGPPGVGKTSLARSVARALGREFARISLGGVHDEAEIRGHRRTYIGALPGKIVQAMSSVKTVNPVILLDEIDKLTHDVMGDPASALLEVLDPEQNKTFVDNFLEIGYDLSRVLFITTANHPDGIPYALYDRMEVISLSGYTDPEKAQIAQKFLITKALSEHGLDAARCSIPRSTIDLLTAEYTREAGVRQLERLIGKLVRKVIQALLHAKDKKKTAANKKSSASETQKEFIVTPKICREWLGIPLFKKKRMLTKKHGNGTATGLAWTEVGGDVLEVEATIMPGKGELLLTGQLGEVMRESAQAALSYVRSKSGELGLAKTTFTEHDFHVHVPEGATPKDGPSAGITICAALVSACTKNPVRADIAMTGEITLGGRVLPVGGLKEKLIAAQQYQLKTVLVPQENQQEVEKIIKEVDQNGKFVARFVHSMDDVLLHALERNPFI